MGWGAGRGPFPEENPLFLRQIARGPASRLPPARPGSRIPPSHPRSTSFAFRAEAGGKSLGRSQGDSLAPANSTPRALGSRAAPLSSCESPRRLGAGPPPRGSARDLLRPGWVGGSLLAPGGGGGSVAPPSGEELLTGLGRLEGLG